MPCSRIPLGRRGDGSRYPREPPAVMVTRGVTGAARPCDRSHRGRRVTLAGTRFDRPRPESNVQTGRRAIEGDGLTGHLCPMRHAGDAACTRGFACRRPPSEQNGSQRAPPFGCHQACGGSPDTARRLAVDGQAGVRRLAAQPRPPCFQKVVLNTGLGAAVAVCALRGSDDSGQRRRSRGRSWLSFVSVARRVLSQSARNRCMS